MNKKGSKSSKNGKKYEIQVFNVVKYCKLNDNFFNKQNIYDLEGCTSKNDIECIYNDIQIQLK